MIGFFQEKHIPTFWMPSRSISEKTFTLNRCLLVPPWLQEFGAQSPKLFIADFAWSVLVFIYIGGQFRRIMHFGVLVLILLSNQYFLLSALQSRGLLLGFHTLILHSCKAGVGYVFLLVLVPDDRWLLQKRKTFHLSKNGLKNVQRHELTWITPGSRLITIPNPPTTVEDDFDFTATFCRCQDFACTPKNQAGPDTKS